MKETISVSRTHEVLSLITGISFTNVPSWYGATRRDLKMDLIVPKIREGHRPLPVIIWICGGAYMVVDHSVWIPEMLRFARTGYVIASIEYRTSNEAQFPAALEDCQAAVRFLKEHAGDYAIDPEHIFVMGESAGGTMASLVGLTLPQDISGVVDFYGLSDLTGSTALAPGNPAVPDWTVKAFLGAAYTEEDARKASAVHLVTPEAPPFLILHGTEDALVPIAQSEALYEKLLSNGVRANFLAVTGANHGDDLLYQDDVIDRILDFLNSCL